MSYEKIKKGVVEILGYAKDSINLDLLVNVDNEDDVENLMDYIDRYLAKYDLSDFKIDVSTNSIKKGEQYKCFFDYVKNLTASEFEQLCAKLAHVFGYKNCFATKTSHDQGIDFIGSREFQYFKTTRTELIIGQCKNYREGDVKVNEVRELAGAILLLRHNEFSTKERPYRRFSIKSFSNITGVFFSSYFYTDSALKLCESSDIIPLTLLDIIFLLNKGCNEKIFDIKFKSNKINKTKLSCLHKDIEIIQ